MSNSHSAAGRRRRNNSHSALFFFALLILAVYLLDLSGHGRRGSARSAVQQYPSADDVILMNLGGEAMLAAQRHDLSFAGFANRSHHWHVFRGDEGVIPNARLLSFRNTYRDLIGGIKNLPNLPLGRAAAVRATEALASYDPDAASEEETAVLKRAVAALSVMLIEAMRLKPIREIVNDGWESEACVKAEHLPYIEHWDTMSFELLRWNRTGAWDGQFTELLRKSANIHSAEEALAIASVLANPTLPQPILAHTTT